MSSKESNSKTSFRRSIKGPYARILIGPDLEEFILPKALLSETSTYFEAALNGTFLEATEQKIGLDIEDPDVFQTYTAWLYQRKISSDDLNEAFPTAAGIEKHLIALYDFADRRGIDVLLKDSHQMFASYLAVTGPAHVQTLHYAYSLHSTSIRHSDASLRTLLVSAELVWGTRLDLRDLRALPETFKESVLHRLFKTKNTGIVGITDPKQIRTRFMAWVGLPKDLDRYHKSQSAASVQEQEPSNKRKRDS